MASTKPKVPRRHHPLVVSALWLVALGVLAWGMAHQLMAYKIAGVVLLLPAALVSRHGLIDALIDDFPRWLKNPRARQWQGAYHAFDDHHVRVIEGSADVNSSVVLADILYLVKQPATEGALRRLKLRFGERMTLGEDPRIEGLWVLEDQAVVDYIRSLLSDRKVGETAGRLLLWLERTVFRPIDNRRTAETGKLYAFSKR